MSPSLLQPRLLRFYKLTVFDSSESCFTHSVRSSITATQVRHFNLTPLALRIKKYSVWMLPVPTLTLYQALLKIMTDFCKYLRLTNVIIFTLRTMNHSSSFHFNSYSARVITKHYPIRIEAIGIMTVSIRVCLIIVVQATPSAHVSQSFCRQYRTMMPETTLCWVGIIAGQ
jgi:hypothetical protein